MILLFIIIFMTFQLHVQYALLQPFQLAQPVRLLQNYVGEDFEDVQYEQGDGKA